MPKVLVVEDNPDNMTLAVFLLQSAGHTVISATSAEVGLSMARAEKPDLILMDIQLPGMDGLEAIGQLKKDPLTRAIPVFALTALAMKGDEERIRTAGCNGYIAKPIRYKEFLATVATAIAGSARLILIVDDEPDNRDLLEILLMSEGFNVQTSSGGDDALACIAKRRPDLVLLDLMMPGMSGYEVLAVLKADASLKTIPVVMVTALDGAARKQAQAAGADGFLGKPIDRAELRARVNDLLPATRA